ncbi:MAG: hypothetical protein M1395_05280 [Bacteroidetes bacterium]|nr:hypothetical protein [Bacteroidota bacterium]
MKQYFRTFVSAFALLCLFSFSSNAQNKTLTVEQVKRMCGVPVDTAQMKVVLARGDSMYKAYLKNIQNMKSKQFKVETIPN